MNRKIILIISIILTFVIVLSGCRPNNGNSDDLQGKLEEKDMKIAELEDEIEELKSQLTDSDRGEGGFGSTGK